LYNEAADLEFNEKTRSKIISPGIKNKDLELLNPANGINLAKLAIQYANGVIMGSESLPEPVTEMIKSCSIPLLPYMEVSQQDTTYIHEYVQFYDQILGKNVK
jgi:starch synthase